MQNKLIAKPFLKWAGGKSQLLEQFNKLYPQVLKMGKIKTYVEPFIGGGAVLFDILSNYSIENIYISDVNKDLVLTYRVIQSNVLALINKLSNLQDEYVGTDDDKKEDYYYAVRDSFNIGIMSTDYNDISDKSLDRAAQLIFLNKTCFNGLFRVNSKGKYNVPWGKHKNPTICDAENLKAVNIALEHVRILNSDFEDMFQYINEDTFVYFDPPYRPLPGSPSFKAYAMSDFNDNEQIRLANFYKSLSCEGVFLMLSNSDPKNSDAEDNFFDELYKEFNINRVKASRMINSKGNGRGAVSELLILNYNYPVEEKQMKENSIFAEKINCNTPDDVFKYLLSTLKDSIKGWDYFVNWSKAIGNIKDIEIELNILNYLVGKENIELEFKYLLGKHPQVYKLLPILIACREKSFNILNPQENKIFNYENFEFKKKNNVSDKEINKAVEFASNVGLLELFSNKTIKNVVDYVFGIEVGLDSNGRKNRSGTSMETLVELFINNLCVKHSFKYLTQATSTKIAQEWGINVTVDKSERRFDFAVNNGLSLYLIETNFYGGGGSKLKATAGEYKALYDFIKQDNHKFIWTTDGKGWDTAARPLEETFNHIDYILNLDMIEKSILEDIIVKNL